MKCVADREYGSNRIARRGEFLRFGNWHVRNSSVSHAGTESSAGLTPNPVSAKRKR